MKLPLLVLGVLFILGSLSIEAQPSTWQEFVNAYLAAVMAKDPDKIKALTYSVGMNEDDQKQMMAHLDNIFNDQEIAEVTLEPLPDKYKPQRVINGKELQPTFPPTGLIKIRYKPVTLGGTTTTSSSSRPYAVIDGHYFLVPNKSTTVPVQIYALGSGSDSPSGEYHIVVEKEGDPGSEVLAYGVVKSDSNKVVWPVSCSYKMGSDGDDAGSLQKAQAAKVYWNKDGSRFVLDEATDRFTGSAILGTVIESSGSLTTHTFTPGDLHMTGLAQWRIHIGKGWAGPSTLSLEIVGVNASVGGDPGASVTQDFTCEVEDESHFRFTKVQ